MPLLGLALVSRPEGEVGARIASGVGLALVAALGFGFYFVFLDIAADDSASWAVLVARLTSSIVALVATLAVGASLAMSRRVLIAVLAVGACDVGANVLFALASTRGLVSVVSVLASLYPAVTVALAALLLHERLGRVQLAGAAAVLTGAALLAAG